MLKLRRLKVDRLRNIAPGTELLFNDGLNVLLGQNGSGKTTLLELISAVLRADFSAYANEEFSFSYDLWAEGVAELHVHLSSIRLAPELRKPGAVGGELFGFLGPELKKEFTVSGTKLPDKKAFHFELNAGPDGLQPRLIVTVGEKQMLAEGEPRGVLGLTTLRAVLFLATMINSSETQLPVDDEALAASIALSHPLLECSALRFDESLDYFQRLFGRDGIPGELLRVAKQEYPAPESLPYRVLIDLLRTDEDQPASPKTIADAPFLTEVARLMGFQRVELQAQLQRRTVSDNGIVRSRWGALMAKLHFGSGEFISQDSLSYGQKRLLSFFLYLANAPSVVVADELVNGLHHQWIRACLSAIGERQAFLTSQNPLLLDYLPFGSEEQVRRSFILCRSEPSPGRPTFAWSNLSPDDATEFFSAYQLGIEHVSEILQSRGLW